MSQPVSGTLPTNSYDELESAFELTHKVTAQTSKNSSRSFALSCIHMYSCVYVCTENKLLTYYIAVNQCTQRVMFFFISIIDIWTLPSHALFCVIASQKVVKPRIPESDVANKTSAKKGALCEFTWVAIILMFWYIRLAHRTFYSFLLFFFFGLRVALSSYRGIHTCYFYHRMPHIIFLFFFPSSFAVCSHVVIYIV